jgi:tetratricopeptide (TPR) repeat protein
LGSRGRYGTRNIAARIMNRRQRRANAKRGCQSVDTAAAAALGLGLEYHKLGKFTEAVGCYRRVLATQPNHPDALQLIGAIAYQAGRYDIAIEYISNAVKLNGHNPTWFSKLGLALERQGRLEESLASHDKSLELKPDYVEAFNNRGNVLQALGRTDEALASYDEALALDPNRAEVLNNRGNLLKHLKRLDEALVSYDRAVELNPNYAAAINNRGNVLRELGRIDEALTCYDTAFALNPSLATALNNRGTVLKAMNRLEEAVVSFDRALALNPDFAEAHSNRGGALTEVKRYHEALSSFDTALALSPNLAPALNNRGNLLQELGRTDEALADYDRALALDPNYAEATNGRGSALQKLGLIQEAEEALRRAILLRPDYAEAYEAEAVIRRAVALKPDLALAHHNLGIVLVELGRLTEAREAAELSVTLAPREPLHFRHLGEVRKYIAGDPYLTALEALSEDEASLAIGKQIDLHFALAKAHADIGQTEEEFRRLLVGNKLKRSRVDYNEALVLGEMDRAQQVFSSEFMRATQNTGEPSTKPIFIIGMPRSGTTLIEQILASHPQVFGAGELTWFERAFGDVRSTVHGAPAYPEIASRMSREHFQELGRRYLDAIRQLAPAASRVTDKMPLNFVFAGLIHLALPNSTIIHTLRDPVDTCISCFSRLFTEGNFQTYDLAELARYYRHYEALMGHWHHVLPPGRILDVNYEDTVANVEGVARRVVSHCGLPWDKRCLDFHRTERTVRTSSATQVRRPIYASSVGRRHAYGALLEPLLAELLPMA